MPLSKARDKERKRLARLEKRAVRPSVQPKPSVIPNMYLTIPQYVDADGNPVYEP